MELHGSARRVRIYLDEGDRHGHQPLSVALVALLRDEGAAGATVFRGSEGFGSSGTIRTARLVDVEPRLPVVVEWVDRAECVARLLPQVLILAPNALVTVEDTSFARAPRPASEGVPVRLVAGDVMSRDVTSVGPHTPIREVVELVAGKGYRAVPVIVDGIPVGIVTNGDLVRRGGLAARVELLSVLGRVALEEELARLGRLPTTAGDVMTRAPLVVRYDTPLPDAAARMVRHRRKRLPVVDGDGRLVGMLSRVDVLRAVVGGSDTPEGPAARRAGLAVDAPLERVLREDVPVVALETPLADVLRAVLSTRLNRALVLDAERHVLGIVSDADVLARLSPAARPGILRVLMRSLPFGHRAEEQRLVHAETAGELMAGPPPALQGAATVGDAVCAMVTSGAKIAAVVDEAGRLLGVVDRADVLRGLLD